MAKSEDLSNVPSVVLKQQRAAEKLMKKAQEPSTPEAGNTEEPAKTVQPAAETAVATEPETVAPVQQAAPAIPTGQETDQFKHKYDVLKGKYNAETTALREQAVDLQAQLDRQSVLIENMTESQQSVNSEPSSSMELLNPEDFSGWGDEMQVMVRQMNELKQTVSKQAAELSKRPAQQSQEVDPGLNNRLESLESDAQKTRTVTYMNYLDQNIKGDWRALNVLPAFIEWLQQVDPISFQPRASILSAAADALRGDQVASIFNLFIAENGATSGSVVATEIPNGGGHGNLTPETGKTPMSTAVLVKAQGDYVKGRITEEEYSKISADYQKSLRG